MAKNISNLDKSLKQNITPADIGAAPTSHGTHLTIGTGASNAAAGNHTHSNYATTTTTGSLSSLQTSNKSSLVAAINELFQSANNGKQLIASAIGEPLSSSDTFSAMSNKINGLISDLKQVLTDEGVSVTTGESLSSLISKVDSEFDNKDNSMSGIKHDLVDALIAKGAEDITYDTNWEELIGLISKFKDIVNIKFDGIQFLCGGSHAFLLKNDGTVWSTGANGYGQLGSGNTTNNSSFQKVNITNVKQIVCGYNFTAILKNDGSVWTCGGNGYGQLGLGSADSKAHSTFTKVTTNINNDVVQIYAGSYHLFALKADGTVWCCGKNDYGQLGLGSTVSKNTFTQVITNTEDVVQISCGSEHTYILKSNGRIFSCGRNNYGQLGLGSSTDMTTFNHVQSIDNIKNIISGGFHVFVEKKDGTIWACGNNKSGQLGLNDVVSRALFTQVTIGVDDIKQIVCGTNNSFIVRNDGILYAAGENGNGELGMGHTTDVKLFSNVPNFDIVAAYTGEFFTMIIDSEGIVYATGRNDSGQLGLSGSNTRNSFTVVNQLN